MSTELTLPAAFLVGLLGGVHCVGMCGGIVGALSGSLSAPLRQSRWRFLAALLAYNGGRIASYTAAGLLLGFFGQQVSALQVFGDFPLGRVISAVFMILFGIYLAGWWHALRILEQAGTHLWRRIEPWGRRYVPVRGAAPAFMLGLVWGWLPCGMVYAVLALALASGDPIGGGQVMLAFGLGTLPLMVAMGFALGRLARVLQSRLLRNLAGVTVLLFGLYTLLAPSGHGGHAPHAGDGHHHPGDHASESPSRGAADGTSTGPDTSY